MESEEAERGRLRRRIEGTLIQKEPPKNLSGGRIARGLRRSDGADIVKRNASRKKRYLMVFPGGMTLQPGAKIGQLEGLSTRTPRLTIECPNGRLELKGSLTFPNNGLILVKGGALVKVIDCFEVAIVFGEWAWIGSKQSNPGGVPEPIPARIMDETPSAAQDVWNSTERAAVAAEANGHGADASGQTKSARKRKDKASFIIDDDDDDDFISDDEPSDDLSEPKAEAEVEIEEKKPATKKRKKSILALDGDNEDGEDGDDGVVVGDDDDVKFDIDADVEVGVNSTRPTRKRKKSIIDIADDDIDDELGPNADDNDADDDDDEVIFLDDDNADDEHD